MDIEKLVKENRIMEGLSGSHAYGMATPESDIDHRGLFIAPPLFNTPFYNVGQYIAPAPEDRVLYELTKFMELLVNQNPNIVEFLWMHDDDIFYRTPTYDFLRSHRDALLSSKAKFTFSGYAMAQLKRINSHAKRINNPHPVDPPRQTDFVKLVHNFTKQKVLKFDIYEHHTGYRLIPYDGNLFGVYKHKKYDTFDASFTLNTVYEASEDFTAIKRTDLGWWDQLVYRHEFMYKGDVIRRTPLFIVKFCKEEYNLAKTKHEQYWNWKQNRNKKRSALEEEHQYDTKHASHLIRLMRMGTEILSDGVVNVRRHDAAELSDIRNGKYTYDKIIQLAEDYDAQMNTLYKTTDLQKAVDLPFAANLLLDVQQMWWNK